MAAAPEEEAQDIFYVCEKALKTVKEKLEKGEDITEDLVNELTLPDKVADEEMMVPVDMRGVGEDYDDVEQMLEKLGNKGTAEAFIKAADYFEKNKDKVPEADRPAPMTAAQWKQVLDQDQLLEDGEEELLDMEGEEEDLADLDEDPEEEGEAAEPPSKKAKKTDAAGASFDMSGWCSLNP
eukprot:CAMPEP_0181429734 /NCGR_PEP_ID=MMETSP1110-20121109/17352_1 /TAXON_ID=174948 /ORGANISM="Symbiodinium sp., Strain CCMP421" /LENGTH=180 /DNA_ID=CAMNT_0023553011 /DNA_START=66 /DNA_END=606 /DNA_ORIENTATION=+